MNKTKLDARAITIIGLLMALEIILTRVFSFEVPFFRIGIGFLPGVMIAMMYGPWILWSHSCFNRHYWHGFIT